MFASCEEIFGTRSKNRLNARETRETREKLEGKNIWLLPSGTGSLAGVRCVLFFLRHFAWFAGTTCTANENGKNGNEEIETVCPQPIVTNSRLTIHWRARQDLSLAIISDRDRGFTAPLPRTISPSPLNTD